jgi:hypothetical protein
LAIELRPHANGKKNKTPTAQCPINLSSFSLQQQLLPDKNSDPAFHLVVHVPHKLNKGDAWAQGFAHSQVDLELFGLTRVALILSR